MWIKTRAGLVVLTAPMEVRAWQNKSGTWSIGAQFRTGPEGTTRSIFGKVDMQGPWFMLGLFRDHPGVQEAIAHAFARIAAAAEAGARLCDLSDIGDPDLWSEPWVRIPWPSPTEESAPARPN
jgi:hypothetical protein